MRKYMNLLKENESAVIKALEKAYTNAGRQNRMQFAVYLTDDGSIFTIKTGSGNVCIPVNAIDGSCTFVGSFDWRGREPEVEVTADEIVNNSKLDYETATASLEKYYEHDKYQKRISLSNGIATLFFQLKFRNIYNATRKSLKQTYIKEHAHEVATTMYTERLRKLCESEN